MRRRRQQLAALCLAAGAVFGSAWCASSGEALGAEPAGFLLPPISSNHGLGFNADEYLVPAERKFVRLSERLISLPSDGAEEVDGDTEETDSLEQRRSRLRRLRFDDVDVDVEADREDSDEYDDRDDEQSDDGMSSSLTDQRISQNADGGFKLPPLAPASTTTEKIGNGRTPDGFRGNSEAHMVPLAESGDARQLDAAPWAWSVSHWAAANTYSHPRYFEDRMLERHGHERFPALQPLASGARFFATVPMLPYLMTLSHPCDCESTLGYYRSGSCAPIVHQQPPWDPKAALVEAVAVGSAIAIIP